MKIMQFDLWDKVPGMCEEVPKLTVYIPDNKKSDAAVVILPGGAYAMRAEHEGKGYAEFLAENGYTAFVCDYRVAPHRFPIPLTDSRRAVRYARYLAEEYGFDKNKIAIMGSSAGGHLAALTSTYYEPILGDEINDDINKEEFIPNAQILCYPVINLGGKPSDINVGTGKNLLAEEHAELEWGLTPANIVSEKTPKAFIWHTFADDAVNIKNSLNYAVALKNKGINSECHFYPDGHHGMGLAKEDNKLSKHVSEWTRSLLLWLSYIDL